jgi:hypothetical protein
MKSRANNGPEQTKTFESDHPKRLWQAGESHTIRLPVNLHDATPIEAASTPELTPTAATPVTTYFVGQMPAIP